MQEQQSQPFVWALVDTMRPTEPRTFECYVTGASDVETPEALTHLATLLMDGGSFVLHVFERVQHDRQSGKTSY